LAGPEHEYRFLFSDGVDDATYPDTGVLTLKIGDCDGEGGGSFLGDISGYPGLVVASLGAIALVLRRRSRSRC
jgi:hypothetical protein